MALQPIIATVEPDTIARILATNGYRLKSEVRLLVDEYAILQHLDYAEESRVNKTAWEWFFYHYSARHNDLRAATTETIAKLAEVERQLVRFENEGLPQATFSVWGTEMTLLERSHITKALEPQAFEDGAVLIKQGEPRDAFFIIVQGKVSCTPGLDETVLKRGCLLTNQPCESTVTAVGEVQVLVLHGARQCLADYRATGEEAGFGASQTIIRLLLAGREVNEPSTGPDAPLDASTGPDALPEPSMGPETPPTPATEKLQEKLRQRVGRKRP